MNGRRSKLLKRRGETILELREYRETNPCKKVINVGDALHPNLIPASRHGTIVFTDPLRRFNKAVKRQWTQNRHKI